MKLAELIINLTANTANLQRDFDKATRQAEEFAGSMKSALMGLGGVLGVTGITEAIHGLVDYEHEMSDAAAATGMTVQQISSLSYAMKSTDVPLNELQLGLAQFDKIVSGLMRSKAGANAIKELGLNLQQLKTSGAHEALLEVADAFRKFPDGPQKAGIASTLFTSTLGMKLIPVLDEGRTGIEGLESEAQKLGVILTDQDAQAADQTYQAFLQLSASMKGMEIEAGSHLFPALTFLGEILVGDAFAVGALKDRLEELGLEWLKLASFADPETAIFGGGLRKKLQEDIDQKATNEAILRDDMTRRLKALTISGISNGTLHFGSSGAAGGPADHVKQVASAIRSLSNELVGLSQGEVAKGMAQLREIGASPAQLAQGNALLTQIANLKSARKAQEDFNSAFKEYASLQRSLFDSTSKLTAAQKDYIGAVMQLNELGSKGIDIHEGLKMAQDKYRQQVMKDNPIFSGGGVPNSFRPGSDIFMNAANVPALSIMKKMQSQAQMVGQTMSSMFEGMTLRGESFKQMLNGITEQLAEFLLKATVFNSLANVFGGNATSSSGSKGGGIGGLLAGFFAGLAGRASGGPVTSGSLYMVGESGPELFAPGASGSIIPNGGAGGSARASGSTVNIDARGADAGVEARIARAMDAMGKKVLGQSLVMNYEYQARGGQL